MLLTSPLPFAILRYSKKSLMELSGHQNADEVGQAQCNLSTSETFLSLAALVFRGLGSLVNFSIAYLLQIEIPSNLLCFFDLMLDDLA